MLLKFPPRRHKQNLLLLPNKWRHDSTEDHSGGTNESIELPDKAYTGLGLLTRGVNDPLLKGHTWKASIQQG